MHEILQVAYTASSSLFGEDKEHYPRFFRLIPVAKQLVHGCVALIDKFHWKRVAVVTHDDEFYFNVYLHICTYVISCYDTYIVLISSDSQAKLFCPPSKSIFNILSCMYLSCISCMYHVFCLSCIYVYSLDCIQLKN